MWAISMQPNLVMQIIIGPDQFPFCHNIDLALHFVIMIYNACVHFSNDIKVE